MRACATILTVLLACASGCDDGGGSRQGSGGSSGSKSSGHSGGSSGGHSQSGGSKSSGGNSSSSSSRSSGGSGGESSSAKGGSSATSSGGVGGSDSRSATGGSAAGSRGGQTGGNGGTRTSGSSSSGSGGQTSGGTGGSTRASGGTGGSSQATGGAPTLSTSDPNVVAIVIDSGPEGSSYINGPFAKVTLCEPGTSNCQEVDHLLIDTGSIGLRVLQSKVKLKLPAATNSNGKSLAECLPFLSGTAWGEVRMADLKIGGEAAPKMRVHLIGETTYPLPRDCTGTPINDSESLNSNGILGIGLNVEDCGAACNRKVGNPGVYYECSSTSTGGCAVAAVPLANQLVNPISAFPEDNNGSFMQFPSVAAGGASTLSGYLVFGIGTRANNQLGNAQIVPVDAYGELTTTYNGKQYNSFIDSGSNGYFFLNSSLSKIPSCSSGAFTGFYCPQNTMNLTATMAGKSGNLSVSFTVGNASKLSVRNTAFAELGGPLMDDVSDASMPGFDWGLPFHLGRTVFCAIEGKSTPVGDGPYFAF